MSTPQEPTGHRRTDVDEPDEDATADELESDIEHIREQLGETVDALTQKLDVKSRGQEKVAEVKHNARVRLDDARSEGTAWWNEVDNAMRDDDGQMSRAVPIGAIAVAVAVVVFVVWKVRR